MYMYICVVMGVCKHARGCNYANPSLILGMMLAILNQ